MKNLYTQNISIIANAHIAAWEFNKQNHDTALRRCDHILKLLSKSITEIATHLDYFNQSQEWLSITPFLSILESMEQAQKQRDYLLLGDLLSSGLAPLLSEIQTYLYSIEGNKIVEKDYEKNLSILRQMGLKNELDNITTEVLCEKFQIEATNSGAPTLKVKKGTEEFYLHSNLDPILESFQFAEYYYDPYCEDYVVFGLSLGYHITRLVNFGAEQIHVYENNLEIIRAVCRYTGLLEQHIGQVFIHYDPDLTQFSAKIKRQTEEKFKVILHSPSIRTIENPTLRARFEQLFIADSSIRNQKNSMISNFYSNIKNCDGSVEELRESFSGKNIFLIAAGPSLDKNITQLKDKPQNSLIVAVGTVYKKLLKLGIEMDYVIFSDANTRVQFQIQDVSSLTTDALILSTAYKAFAKKMQGKKYLICQKDFELSEKYAKEHNSEQFQTGGSVMTAALDVSIRLGAKRIIFLGLDLAYTNQLAHAADTSRREHKGTEGLQAIPSVNGGTVYASNSFIMFREWIERRISDVSQVEFIDATEGGAFIKGTKISKLEDILTN